LFKIIPIGQFEKNTVFDWFLKRNQINFEPPYQRIGGIWDLETKQFFLDSIVNSFDIPKIYIHYFPDKFNSLYEDKMYAIIDGKQRMQTIFEFLDGKINLGDNIVYFKDPSISIKNFSYADLAEKHRNIRSDFDNYVLDIVYVISDEKDRIEELFARLNEGKPLNNAEKRNALGGSVVDAIRDLSSHPFFRDRVFFDDRRYDYYDLTAKILLLENEKKLITLSKKNLDKLVINNRNNQEIFNRANDSKIILNTMSNIFCSRDPLLETKALIPIYYWFVRSNLHNVKPDIMRGFFESFSQLRKANRSQQSYETQIPVLLEFDRLNQQGTNSVKSLKKRLDIIIRYFDEYKKSYNLLLSTYIKVEDLDIFEE